MQHKKTLDNKTFIHPVPTIGAAGLVTHYRVFFSNSHTPNLYSTKFKISFLGIYKNAKCSMSSIRGTRYWWVWRQHSFEKTN